MESQILKAKFGLSQGSVTQATELILQWLWGDVTMYLTFFSSTGSTYSSQRKKPQQKRLLFIIFLKGIATNTLYSALLLLMMTNLSENKFSQIGVGLAG